MKKSSIIITISIIVIILIIATFYYTKTEKNKKLLTSVQDKIIFFYGEGCPHCLNVEKFVQDNNVESKVQFDKKEVWGDKQNAYLMTLVATKKCNLPENELGVPFLWYGPDSKCFLGDQSIIDFFKQKIGI